VSYGLPHWCFRCSCPSDRLVVVSTVSFTRTLSSSHAVRCLVQGGVTVLGVSYLGVLDLPFLTLGHGDSRVGD
jgi:hypothetical protein